MVSLREDIRQWASFPAGSEGAETRESPRTAGMKKVSQEFLAGAEGGSWSLGDKLQEVNGLVSLSIIDSLPWMLWEFSEVFQEKRDTV